MASNKYPRIPHLPWSLGRSSDDKVLKSAEHFVGKNIILSEKIDGSNVCLEKDDVFARSHNGPPNHPSFDRLKALHATYKPILDSNLQVFGEWALARHSIKYNALPGYLLIFGVRDIQNDSWWSWEATTIYAAGLQLPTVPILFEGVIESEKELQKITEEFALHPSCCGGEREGAVVRLASAFPDGTFGLFIAKWVRKGHVTTDTHWRNQKIIPNELKK